MKTFPLANNIVSITIVGLILTKLWWFQLISTSQKSISTFQEEKFKFLGFHGVVLVMYQIITTVGLTGYGHTDTILESSYRNDVSTKKKKFNSKLKIIKLAKTYL